MAHQPGEKPLNIAGIQRPPLFKVYGLQFLLLVLASASLLLMDEESAKSVLAGGLISVLPNAYFARLVFRYRGARAAQSVAQSFYRGEAGKFVMTVVMFALAFSTVKPLKAELLFAAFLLMTVINTVFAWQLAQQKSGR